MSYCPECEAVIDEEFEDIGEIITCPECGVELEVISIDPVEFDLAVEDDEEDDEFGFDEGVNLAHDLRHLASFEVLSHDVLEK